MKIFEEIGVSDDTVIRSCDNIQIEAQFKYLKFKEVIKWCACLVQSL